MRQLPWSHNLLILSRCKRPEEREFYLRLAQRDRWSRRDLERHLGGSLFERAVLNPPRVSTALRELHPGAQGVFRDSYLVEFLELPEGHLGVLLALLFGGGLRSLLYGVQTRTPEVYATTALALFAVGAAGCWLPARRAAAIAPARALQGE